jgi:hypothetical protein
LTLRRFRCVDYDATLKVLGCACNYTSKHPTLGSNIGPLGSTAPNGDFDGNRTTIGPRPNSRTTDISASQKRGCDWQANWRHQEKGLGLSATWLGLETYASYRVIQRESDGGCIIYPTITRYHFRTPGSSKGERDCLNWNIRESPTKRRSLFDRRHH